jgi:hypothetical protein
MPTEVQGAAALPRDPYDALRLENDVLGVRVWGPATQPTLSLGKADIWDRRWFGDRQPLITLRQIREAAMSGRLAELAPGVNRTVYDVYGKYDFPCPKPGAQVILGTPWAAYAQVIQDPDGALDLLIEGDGRSLRAHIWVALKRPVVVIEVEHSELAPGDLWLRAYRHRDTILPGDSLNPTLGDRASVSDFDSIDPPRAWSSPRAWGIAQTMPAEMTFPHGFTFAAGMTVLAAEPMVECREDERGLGTVLWAPREGRLSHGVIKRYAPINEATGAAATARFGVLSERFAILATAMTTQDDPDPVSAAQQALDEALALGIDGLGREQSQAIVQGRRAHPARAAIEGIERLAAPSTVRPSLRRAGGYYGDVPLCSVESTKFCFQDSALWHADFHLNELRAEPMLTLGQFEELLPYCRLIYDLLPQAQENARDVYDLPGAMYPLVHFPLRCRGIAHTNLTWEQDMGLNGLVSKPLWLYYRYTGDEVFLRERAWPVLRECARFMAAYVAEEADGRCHIVPTVSPEHWGLTGGFERNRDCLSALALTRHLLQAAAGAADVVGEANEECAAWRTIAARLATYPTYETDAGPAWVDVAGAPPIEYNIPVPLAAVFWGDDVGLDSPAETLEIAGGTLDQIRVWGPHRGYLDSCIRPRLGIYHEGAPIGPENLLLSYQSVRLFPALPPGVEVVMRDFAAQGGFRVSAVRTREGEIADVRLRSTLGGRCCVANPWSARPVVAMTSGKMKVARSGHMDTHLCFPTRPGEEYELRPV